jgi:hypothetical protein
MLFSCLISILVSIIFSVTQPEYTLEKELKSRADFFTVDQLGFVYLIQNTEIKKLDLSQNNEKSFSSLLSGKITGVDVADPFKTLLFYKDFNKIIFLDKNLSELTSPIVLDDLGYYNVLSVCQSVNGGFWIFDQSLSSLIYIDKNLNTIKKSSSLSDLIGENLDQKQVFMLEKNDYIYLGISGEGILLFDSYGTYLKTFPLLNIGRFQVNNEIISYSKDEELYFYNTDSYTEKKMPLPIHSYKQVMIVNKKLFIQTEGKILIYKLNNF